MSERQPPPLVHRIDASLAFTGHLLSALVGVSVELAERVLAAWFDAVREHCDRGSVIVFGNCVVGRPDPLLLEVAHHARSLRAAEAEQDDEGGSNPTHDPLGLLEAPRLHDRVVAALGRGRDADRVVGWSTIDVALARTLHREREQLCAVVDVIVAIEILAATWARTIRIGEAAVISTRPTVRALPREPAA